MMPLNRLIWSVALLWLAGCASQGPQAPSANERRADVYLESGIDSLERRDYTAALRAFNNALTYNSKSPLIWNNLGIAYMGKGEPQKAEESWKKALSVDSSFNDARLNLGIFYFQKKRYPEAERTLKETTKDLAYQKAHQAYYQLGLMYLTLKKPLLAEQQFKLSVKENSVYCPAWMQLGLLQKERGDITEAAQSLKNSVMGTCFKNPQAHYEIAALYLKANETHLAKTKLLEIIQLFPTSEWASRSEATLNMIR